MPNAKVLFKFGTAAQYAALETKLDNALYFLLDTNELYRGTVPIARNHVYLGTRAAGDTDGDVLITALNGSIPVPQDIVIIRNTDNTSDAFIYGSDGNWYPLGNSSSVINSMATDLEELTDRVSDLESLLNGTPADPENETPAIPGLVDRVATLESQIAGQAGAFHFKGVLADLDALEAIQDMVAGDVWQIGSDEYAWNGTTWVKLGGEFDLSNYVTSDQLDDTVADLETLIGHPATTEEDPDTGETIEIPATGLYAEIANIPLFNGVVAGLVPVADSELTAQQKATRFLNALGNWVEVQSSAGGQNTYTDPEGNVYNSVEDYVTYMLENHSDIFWEEIS